MARIEDYYKNFSNKELFNFYLIKQSSTYKYSFDECRNIIIKLNNSLETTVNDINTLESTIIEKNIEYEELHNAKSILTCTSIFLIFACMISFAIGYFVGNKSKK